MNVSHTSTYNLDWRLNEERVHFNSRSIHYIPQTWASNENKKMINLDKRKRKIWIKMLLPSIVKLVKYVTRDIRPHHTCVSIVNSYNLSLCENRVRTMALFIPVLLTISSIYNDSSSIYFLSISRSYRIYLTFVFIYWNIYMIYKFSFLILLRVWKFPSLQCFKNMNFVKKWFFFTQHL